jgi:rhamnosyltransferase subunit A
MPAEKLLIVRVANSYNVSVKRHIYHARLGSGTPLDGARAITASSWRTIKYLSEHYFVLYFDLSYADHCRQCGGSVYLLVKEEKVRTLLEQILPFEPKFLDRTSADLPALLALPRDETDICREMTDSLSPFLVDARIDNAATASDFLPGGEAPRAMQVLNGAVGQYLTSLPNEAQQRYAFHGEQISPLKPATYLAKRSRNPRGGEIRCQRVRRIDHHRGYTQLARYTKSVRFAAMRNAGYLRGDEGRGAHATGIREEMLEFFGGAEPIAMPESLAVPASVSILAAQAQTFALVGLNALVQATAPFVEFLSACPGRAISINHLSNVRPRESGGAARPCCTRFGVRLRQKLRETLDSPRTPGSGSQRPAPSMSGCRRLDVHSVPATGQKRAAQGARTLARSVRGEAVINSNDMSNAAKQLKRFELPYIRLMCSTSAPKRWLTAWLGGEAALKTTR